ncbi:hypothetical protein [Burkholderia metallica]|uniref:hypothetical protein n=1 Tax=Burkholderia metallica TaxID=488729 RepID=UPI0015757862|nr:hypothetical protein [Burkholderia metallica]
MCAPRIARNEIAVRLEARQRAARIFRERWRSARASAMSPLPDRSASTAARSSMALRTSSVASGLSMNRQPRLIEVEVLNNPLPGDMNMPLCSIGCQPQYRRPAFKINPAEQIKIEK